MGVREDVDAVKRVDAKLQSQKAVSLANGGMLDFDLPQMGLVCDLSGDPDCEACQ